MDNGINDSFLERFVWNVFTNAYQMKIKGADDMRRRNVCARELRRQAARGAAPRPATLFYYEHLLLYFISNTIWITVSIENTSKN